MGTSVRVGDVVRVRRGEVGEGYTFTVESVGESFFGEPIVYGHNYGPRRVREIDVVRASRS